MSVGNAKVIPFPKSPAQAASLSPQQQWAVAPLKRRALASVIDLALVWGIAASWLLAVLPNEWINLWRDPFFLKAFLEGSVSLNLPVAPVTLLVPLLLGLILVSQLYFILYEWKNGATPGKVVMGIKVRTLNGEPPTIKQIIARESLRFFEAPLFLPTLLCLAMTKNRQRLGDVLAGTWVTRMADQELPPQGLFLGEEQYLWISERAGKAFITEPAAEAYMQFAFPYFILEDRFHAHLKEDWDQVAKAYFPALNEVSMSTDVRLRFFAEKCLLALGKHWDETRVSLSDNLLFTHFPRCQPAHPLRRFLAVLIDALILWSLLLPAQGLALYIHTAWIAGGTPLAFHPRVEEYIFTAVSLGLSFPIAFVYFGWFYRHLHATPGKLILGLRVFSSHTGAPLGYLQTCLRETAGKAITLLSCLIVIGFLFPFAHRHRRALHDFLTRTQVVDLKRQ